ncbi:MAG: endolytic transglycosylase MltG [bacterium]|nr:endolytic transglycosylase MltG [bacterium]
MDFFKRHIVWVLAFTFAMLLVGSYQIFFAAPANFPTGTVIKIATGASASEVAAQLATAHIIKNQQLLRAALRLSGGSVHIQAGPYLFSSPQDVLTVAYRLAAGDFGIPPVRITFPEGEAVRDVAERIHEALSGISASDFLSKGQSYEGYLFPDTYFFPPSANADSIIKTMRGNFNEKISLLLNEVNASGHSLSDIIVMASLIEKEARTSPVRHMVSGILWNRYKLGMPLQVDAVFGYIYGRDTYSPSFADLKVVSPYNTYTHTGLPPGPIDNPGLDAIDAALHPTKTDYLYYLTDPDGVMHYATTYAGHQANQRKYLK